MVKLIALDLDGTLLDPAGQITAASRQAIAAARAAGVRVVLATGRSIQEAAWFVGEAGCDALTVSLGGAALADAGTGEVLFRRDIPDPSGREALALCLGKQIELMIFAGNEILLDPFSHDSLSRSYPYPCFFAAAVRTRDPLDYMARRGLPLTKLFGDRNPAVYPLAELEKLPGVALTSSGATNFEVVADGVDKGRALGLLARRYGLTLAECAAVGDSDNDLAMLRAVGTPIAMGNASPRIKDLAVRTAPSNAREGAAAAIMSCLE